MPGKLDLGSGANDLNGAVIIQPNVQDSRAYEDGVKYRMSGAALAVPITDNPHLITGDTVSMNCWDAGWSDADGGTIAASSAYAGQTAPL